MDVRLVVIDGSCFDVPDSEKNARDMERPNSRPGTFAAIVKMLLVVISQRIEVFEQGRYGKNQRYKPSPNC